ncbi:hypothetical protein ACFYWN_41120 [Streptomyces sp. NPDC002917]|uniref:hypothetical protein n=1 Tax=Streptomyces sp. NPDC002917 TaxID=3364671 RepID=UPI00367627FD
MSESSGPSARDKGLTWEPHGARDAEREDAPTKERVRHVAAIAAASLVLVALVAALGMAALR